MTSWRKNKKGKFLKYAIGEIVLVMIGILLALQVNNWNGERKKRSAENEVLVLLNDDFNTAKKQIGTLEKIIRK